MASLEQIAVGSIVSGIAGANPVTVVAVKWYGTAVLEITFKDSNGNLGSQLLYREDEERIEIMESQLPWRFDADGNLLRLVSEAYRIQLAHLFDPYLAVHISDIDPLPHQITAVYQEMLPRLPLRYILADDPGAGKTIMTGLLIKELLIRGDLKRCLIVTPGSLAEQWQDELYRKFNLRFEILTNDRMESAVSGNIFIEVNFCIARLDKLSRSAEIQEKLRVTDWDLIVCDEAHKMSATVWGGEIKYTKRFQLGRLLSRITRHFLLLTATPHNGKEEDFQLFMSLIDQDRFEGVLRSRHSSTDVSDVMRRLVKEELLKFDGTPLFPERLAYTVTYTLSPMEAELYQAVTEYVREEFNRADQLNNERKTTVGFALTVLQRRLASSPEAIYQSLRRRRERLEQRLAEERIGKRADDYQELYEMLEDYDDEDLPSAEREEQEERVADQATAATTIHELEAEIQVLKRLERMANEVRVSGVDRKWEELSSLLQDNDYMFGSDGRHEKLIIFTEHRDTLRYLADKIRSLLGHEAVLTIHGGMLRDERRKVENEFRQNKDVIVLIATDAAGEGINLQRAHLMINYDLPWNPNRLEQRFGRIHRIGQTEVCHLWNLVSEDTQEGKVYKRLLDKLEEERKALGGKVFDILGKVTFDNRPLRELLVEAIRYGDDPNVRSRLYQVVDHSLDREKLQSLLAERALSSDIMDVSRVTAIREEMERMEARKLQPHFIETFFLEAFRSAGGKIHPRESGRYEITFVPHVIRNRDIATSYGIPILHRYERVCFDKADRNGHIQAELICPGHPLLDATIDVILERNRDVLKRGAIFIDENDDRTEARLLFYIESAIQDGVVQANGNKRVISKSVHFVEMMEDGTAVRAGYAPYLDYRAASLEEQAQVRAYLNEQPWLQADIEERALNFAIAEIIPPHYAQVKADKHRMIDKIAKAVKERLTAAIQYWDYRAAELKQKEAAGKTNARLNSQQAARRAEELEARLHKRLAELEAEKMISALPPVVVGGALVIPRGLLNRLTDHAAPDLFSQGDKQAVEKAAMRAVMDIEAALGYIPRDVSSEKRGYDIESFIPEEFRKNSSCLRFLEVKGRAKGATTVTVSKNEILTALNKPEEFILAIVEVDGDKTNTVYLKRPFKSAPDFGATSVNYSISELFTTSEILLQRAGVISE
mgnify:CR=1 FL=1